MEFTLLVGGQVFFEVEIRQIKLDCGLSISQPEYLAVHFRSFDRLANVVYWVDVSLKTSILAQDNG